MDGFYGSVEVLMRCRVINEPGRLLLDANCFAGGFKAAGLSPNAETAFFGAGGSRICHAGGRFVIWQNCCTGLPWDLAVID